MPILTHLCFDGNNIFAFNDKTAIIVEYETELTCAVPGTVLLSILEGCSDSATLTQVNNEVVIKDKGSIIKLPILPESEFLFDPASLNKGELIGTMTPVIAQALAWAAKNSNEEAIRLNLSGVTIATDGRKFDLYSTDNITITQLLVETKSKKIGKPVSLIISNDSCDILAKAFDFLGGEAKKGKLFLSDHAMTVELDIADSPSIIILCKRVIAEPASYAEMIETSSDHATEFDMPMELVGALKRAVILEAPINIEPQKGALHVTAKGTFGEMQTKIKLPGCVEGEPYLIDANLVMRAADTAMLIGLGAPALTLTGEVNGVRYVYLIAKKG